MDSMDRFVAGTRPVLEEMLKGTGVTATYRLTAEGGEVRLRLDFSSSLSFTDGKVRSFEDLRDEIQSLVRSHLEVLKDAGEGKSRFAPDEPHIEVHGKMRYRDL